MLDVLAYCSRSLLYSICLQSSLLLLLLLLLWLWLLI
jgi:hypothetical protein